MHFTDHMNKDEPDCFLYTVGDKRRPAKWCVNIRDQQSQDQPAYP